MSDFKAGNRVRVTKLKMDEPCSDVLVLEGKVGTVQNPAVPDEEWDWEKGKTYPVTKIQVKLDAPVDMGGYPSQYADTFVFLPEELERVNAG